MKLADLLLRLQQLPPDAEVVARDSSGCHCAIRELHFQRAPGPEIQLVLGDQYVPWDGINSELIDIHVGLDIALGNEDSRSVKTFIHLTSDNAFRPQHDRRFWPIDANAPCSAAGMKPDACSDRSQCLEACGPFGQIPMATCTVHLPNGLVHACERHASTARLQAGFLGSHAYVDQAADGIPCTYCTARAGGDA